LRDDYFPDFDEALEPEVGLLLLVPDGLGLPEVPVSPVLDEPAVPLVPELVEPVAPMLPETEPEVEDGEVEAEELLPGAVESLLLLVVLDGVVLEVDDGEDDVPDDAPVAALPGCLSQPVTAAPAKARTATTGMSFFMTSPISV
jgi:hypothetical protein